MFCKRFCIAVLVVTMIGAVSAVAQDEKNEIGGSLGRIFISDQGILDATYPGHSIHYGKGLTFDIDYARRIHVAPLWSVSGEVIFAYNPDEDVNAGSYGNSVTPSDLKQIFVTPGVRANLFPTTAVSPWVSFGVGFAHYSQDSVLLYGGANPGKSTTSAAIQGGVGLDVRATNRLYIRGGVRDFWAGTPDYPLAPTGKTRQHNYYVFAGAYWRF